MGNSKLCIHDDFSVKKCYCSRKLANQSAALDKRWTTQIVLNSNGTTDAGEWPHCKVLNILKERFIMRSCCFSLAAGSTDDHGDTSLRG